MPSSDTALRRFTAVPVWLRDGPSRLAAAIVVLAAALNAASLLNLVRGPVVSVGIPLLTVFAAVFTLFWLMPLARGRLKSNALRSWRCFATATGLIGTTALATAYHSIRPTFESSAVHHLGILVGVAALALVAAGAWWWPAEKLERRQWIPVALDATTLLLATALGFWVYALHPATSGRVHWDRVGLIAAHVGLSLGLLSTLLRLLFRRQEACNRRVAPLLIGGSVLAVIVGVVPTCHLLATEGNAAPGFLGWTLLLLSIGLGARVPARDVAVTRAMAPTQAHIAIPLVSTGLVGFLLFTSLVSRELWEAHVSLLLPAMFLSIVLIVARQTIVARENLQLARDMQRAKEVAESANTARLHFLANISHDLRTPLNGVLGCSQILLRDPTIAGKQKDLLQTMQGCAEHLRNLINDLLDLSKLEADRFDLAPGPCDLRSFFEALTKTFLLDAERKGLQLEYETDPMAPVWIMADRKRLQQILGNLVHNAIKFTERGSVRLRVRTRNARLLCEVHDTGCGILPDKIGELFRPFHVVDERSLKLEGTGLGLSIAKKLAQKMGGDIRVESVISKGSTFTLDIPFQETTPLVEVQRTIVDYQGRRRRILLVDDQPANRVILRAMLEPLDFLIDECGDGASALRQIGFARPDIILLDLMMPVMDGFELCRKISALPLPLPVPCLAISAMSGEDTQRRCREAGFRELLNKPVNLQLLLEALHQHAGIEWTYGVVQPPPAAEKQTTTREEITPPPPAEIAAFLDLARRGVVRQLEARATQLALTQPEFGAFARRVERYTKDFKLKELIEWLSSLELTPAHGSS